MIDLFEAFKTFPYETMVVSHERLIPSSLGAPWVVTVTIGGRHVATAISAEEVELSLEDFRARIVEPIKKASDK